MRRSKRNKIGTTSNVLESFIPDATLDFHNLGKLLPFDIEKMYREFIEDSQISGHSRLLIITGKGQVVKPLINKLLREDSRIKYFQTAGYFNGQDGAIEVVI